MVRTGGCRCGAIRYEATGKPEHSALCWCNECRASSGAPVVIWTLFGRDAVRIAGKPVSYESSPGTIRQFCGTCGTGLFYLNQEVFAGKIDIQSATFDDPDAFAPAAHIQTADAPRWQAAMADLPHFARFPG